MELANVDLNLLVPLDALLAEESVSKAAQRLHIGQPAMSSSLSRLRSIFNDELLVRDGRGLKPTPFALSLKAPLTQILTELAGLINTGTHFEPLTSPRVFNIIASDYVAFVFLKPLIQKLTKIAPNVQIRVHPIDSSPLEVLRRGNADFLIYPRELLPSNMPFRAQELFEDEFIAVVDIDHPEVGDELTLEQIASLPYLAAGQGILASMADARLDEHHIARNTVMTSQTFLMAPFLLPGSTMFTIVQRRLAAETLSLGKLKAVPLPMELMKLHEIMVWSPQQGDDAGHIWLRKQLVDLAKVL